VGGWRVGGGNGNLAAKKNLFFISPARQRDFVIPINCMKNVHNPPSSLSYENRAKAFSERLHLTIYSRDLSAPFIALDYTRQQQAALLYVKIKTQFSLLL
jgi:hypothetical protein